MKDSLIKYSKDIIVILTCTANLVFIVKMSRQMNKVTENIAFDIDIARDKFRNEVRSFYVRGCMEGTRYPPEWKEAVGIFNKHSIDFYCEDHVKQLDDYINDTTFQFARVRGN